MRNDPVSDVCARARTRGAAVLRYSPSAAPSESAGSGNDSKKLCGAIGAAELLLSRRADHDAGQRARRVLPVGNSADRPQDSLDSVFPDPYNYSGQDKERLLTGLPAEGGFRMDDRILEVKRYWNEISDSEWYRSLRTEERLGRLREKPETAFSPGVLELIQRYVGDFKGKKILLPSSGDNHAAFAFALMGARVTSADISERQLENAEKISDRWKLDVEFVCDNTMGLSKFDDGTFDLVYTSNGTLTWIYDLGQMYRNVARVLKKGGYSAMYDVHPFTRPFTMEARKPPEIRKSYQDVFPDLHWRVQDIVNANAQAGLRILEMAELPSADASFWYTFEELKTKTPEQTADVNDWKCNPMAAIPVWLAMIAQK